MAESKKVMTIKCKKCKRKLFRYLKIGKGSLLRAYKSKIKKIYYLDKRDNIWKCPCGNTIGEDSEKYIRMIEKYKFE